MALRKAWPALVLLFGLAIGSRASAHAYILTSNPTDGSKIATAPSVITITFDEQIDLPEAPRSRSLTRWASGSTKTQITAPLHQSDCRSQRRK